MLKHNVFNENDNNEYKFFFMITGSFLLLVVWDSGSAELVSSVRCIQN